MARGSRRHWFRWQLLPTLVEMANGSWTSLPSKRADWVIYLHRHRCLCLFVPFWISSADFETKFWFAVPSGWAAWPSRCVSAGTGIGWSGTLSPVPPAGHSYRPSWLVWPVVLQKSINQSVREKLQDFSIKFGFLRSRGLWRCLETDDRLGKWEPRNRQAAAKIKESGKPKGYPQ